MTLQEKDLTTNLLDRLNMTEGQKDPEAEPLIRRATRRAARCALFSGANRADPGSEPAQCAESDH
jgi:hypothetical protein